MPAKAVIHEKFGDGIMSAIDFTMDVEKEVDPKGDRVKNNYVRQIFALQKMVSPCRFARK